MLLGVGFYAESSLHSYKALVGKLGLQRAR